MILFRFSNGHAASYLASPMGPIAKSRFAKTEENDIVVATLAEVLDVVVLLLSSSSVSLMFVLYVVRA